MNELDCAYVNAARRLRREQDRESPSHLASDDHLLLIPARQSPCGEKGIGRPDIKGCDRPHRVLLHAITVDDTVSGEILLNTENEIVGDRVLENQPATVPVFGYVGESRIVPLRDAAPCDFDPIDQDLAGGTGPQTGERFDQLRLPVSFDAGDAEYLSRIHSEVDAVDHANAARSHDAEIPHLESLIGRRADWATARLRALSRGERNFAADHESGDFRGRRFRRLDARHRLARAHHGDRVRNLDDFIEPVGDEHNRVALVAQAAEHSPQLTHLGRRQDCRRLVENENSGATEQHLQNLDSLRLTD